MKIHPEEYQVADPSQIPSPGLVLFQDLLQHNLNETIRTVGSADRLRPHCKTHKTRKIIEMQIELGIAKHKCATLREAEMLVDAGVRDVLLAYQLVGPNLGKWVQLVDRFPDVRFASLVDDPEALTMLADAAEGQGIRPGVFLDVDPGMHRTGIEAGESAIQLYEMICTTPNVEPRGLHWYDGHHRQSDRRERTLAVEAAWKPFSDLRNQLIMNGFEVPTVVASGTGSFSIVADFPEPDLELSPGTTTLYDVRYLKTFSDLDFKPAEGILTRVVSKQQSGCLTLDIGSKSCAADPPEGQRLYFPAVPDAEEIKHTEEHLVIRTECSAEFKLGDALVALPTHVCPTSALYEYSSVISGGRLVDRWPIEARGREWKTGAGKLPAV